MYDIAIIGGGPGGYVAAIRGSQLGLKVCLVEQGKVGGTCLNRGCIPTKSLVSSVAVLEHIKQSSLFGIKVDGYTIDFDAIMDRKSRVVSKLRSGVEYLLKKNKVDVIIGKAELNGAGSISVSMDDGGNTNVEAKNIILAAGSESIIFPSLNYDGENIMTSDDILEIDCVPESLLIVGGGVIGCEFACIFNSLGSKVTVVDIMDRLIPNEDEDISNALKSSMAKKGITVMNGVKIKSLIYNGEDVDVHLDDGRMLKSEKVLLSVGRLPNSKGLNLESAGVMLGRKDEVLVDDHLRTNINGIYAIGDITGKSLLAHTASAQGITAVENIAGKDKVMDYSVIPSGIFTSPEVASVGLTERKAMESGIDVRIGKFPFAASGKAMTMGETEGMVKVVVDGKTDRVIGVHIVGPHATDLIAEAAAAIKLGSTVEQLTSVIHAHPTLAECIMEASEAVHGMAVHI